MQGFGWEGRSQHVVEGHSPFSLRMLGVGNLGKKNHVLLTNGCRDSLGTEISREDLD